MAVRDGWIKNVSPKVNVRDGEPSKKEQNDLAIAIIHKMPSYSGKVFFF